MKTNTMIKKGVSLLLALAMILTSFTIMPTTVQAASSSYVYSWDREIPVSGTIAASEYLQKRSKATYSFSSSKPSVAKVSSKGKITGLKGGTTKIKVTEKYKGKKKVIGSFKVMVVKSYLYAEEWMGEDDYLWGMTSRTGYYEKWPYTMDFEEEIAYKIPKATYTVSTKSNKIKLSSKGVVSSVTGKGGDRIKVTVKETYKKKTRTVGSFYIQLFDPQAEKEDTWYIGFESHLPTSYLGEYHVFLSDEQWTDEDIQESLNDLNDPSSTIESNLGTEDSIVKIVLDSDGYIDYYMPQKEGTVYAYIYTVDYTTSTYVYLGYPITITVETYDEDDDSYYYYDD